MKYFQIYAGCKVLRCLERVSLRTWELFLFVCLFVFQFRDSSGARSPGRSTEIVRFETLETFLTVDGKNTVPFSTTDG